MVRLSAMGDVCQSLGAVQALQAQRPELQLHFVTQISNVGLVENLGFASVIPFDRRGGWRARRQVFRAMRQVDAELAIDLQGNWKSAWITRRSGARRCYGAAGSHRQAPMSALLLRRVTVRGPRHPAHVAAVLLQQLLGLELPEAEQGGVLIEPRLRVESAELQGIDAQLGQLGIVAGRPFDVFVLARQDDVRAWPIAEMKRQAAASPHPVLWLQGPAEAAEVLPPGIKLLSQQKGGVRELIALGARVALSGGRVFGPDVGGTHVLAACGAETYALFGPQDPEHTGPPGAHILVRNGAPACQPCRSRCCANPLGPVCMAFGAAAAVSIR